MRGQQRLRYGSRVRGHRGDTGDAPGTHRGRTGDTPGTHRGHTGNGPRLSRPAWPLQPQALLPWCCWTSHGAWEEPVSGESGHKWVSLERNTFKLLRWSHRPCRDLQDVWMWHLGTWFSGGFGRVGLRFGLEDLGENSNLIPGDSPSSSAQRGKRAEQPKPVSDFHPFSRKSSTRGFQLHLCDLQSVRQVCWIWGHWAKGTLSRATALPCSQEVEPCTKSPPPINDRGLSALFSSTSARLILRLHPKSADVYKQR